VSDEVSWHYAVNEFIKSEKEKYITKSAYQNWQKITTWCDDCLDAAAERNEQEREDANDTNFIRSCWWSRTMPVAEFWKLYFLQIIWFF